MIEVYTAKYCNYCRTALDLLFLEGYSYSVIDVTEDQEARVKLFEKSGCNTVPQVFFNDKFVGGCSELKEFQAAGVLKSLFS